jgi:hypothetical protein
VDEPVLPGLARCHSWGRRLLHSVRCSGAALACTKFGLHVRICSLCVCGSQMNLQDVATAVNALPLQRSPARNRVLVICGMWKRYHSVYRNFEPYVRALQAAFEVKASTAASVCSPWVRCACGPSLSELATECAFAAHVSTPCAGNPVGA